MNLKCRPVVFFPWGAHKKKLRVSEAAWRKFYLSCCLPCCLQPVQTSGNFASPYGRQICFPGKQICIRKLICPPMQTHFIHSSVVGQIIMCDYYLRYLVRVFRYIFKFIFADLSGLKVRSGGKFASLGCKSASPGGKFASHRRIIIFSKRHKSLIGHFYVW